MGIMLSCGHDITDPEAQRLIVYPEVTRAGEKAIAYATVCAACEHMYLTRGESFNSEEDAHDWLSTEW